MPLHAVRGRSASSARWRTVPPASVLCGGRSLATDAAALPRRLDVHHIVAGGEHADEAQAKAGGEGLLRQRASCWCRRHLAVADSFQRTINSSGGVRSYTLRAPSASKSTRTDRRDSVCSRQFKMTICVLIFPFCAAIWACTFERSDCGYKYHIAYNHPKESRQHCFLSGFARILSGSPCA